MAKNKKIISYSPQGVNVLRTFGNESVAYSQEKDSRANLPYYTRGSSMVKPGQGGVDFETAIKGVKKEAFGVGSVGVGGDINNSVYDNFFHPSYNPDLYVQPFSVYEERELYRYFYERDPYVGHGIDLLSTLPLSKVHHSMPSTSNHEKAMEIQSYIKMLADKIQLFQLLMSISHEYWLFGNVFIYVEKSLDETDVERVVILDPNLIKVETSYISSENVYYLMPDEKLRDLIGQSFTNMDVRKKLVSIPEELQKAIYDNKQIELNTNAFDGSFVYHMAMRKSPYMPLGTPILRRCMHDLLYRERLRQAQVQIAMRNLAPKHLITTTARLDQGEVEDLRDQVDAAMANPDFAVFTTFDVQWNQIGAENRLLQLSAEYEEFNTRLAAGLGLKKELLFGEGVFGDTKLGIDMLDKRFGLFRDVLCNFVEDFLWAPLCYKKDYVEESGDYTIILTPGLSFSRMSLRDNEAMFANLFQLYSKGSVSIRTVLELFNIDPDLEMKYLQADLFTLNDSRFNDMLSSLYQGLGTKFGDDPRFATLVAERGMNIQDYAQLPQEVASSLDNKILSSKDSDSKVAANKVVLPGPQDKLKRQDIQTLMLEGIRRSLEKDQLLPPSSGKIVPKNKK